MSVWSNINMPAFPELEKDATPDVAVVGGGLSGVLTAYFLRKSGANVVLIEKETIGSGTTSKSTAKISSNQGCYAKIARLYKIDYAAKYYEMQQDAARTYAELVRENEIDCDFTPTVSSLFYRDEVEYEREKKTLDSFARPEEKSHPLFPDAKGIALRENEFLFHPMKFLSAISKDLPIYERTPAIEIDPQAGVVKTPKATIRAENLVLAVRYPVVDLPGWFFAKLWQESSYLFYTKRCSIKVEESYLGEYSPYLTARPYAGGVITGGFNERTGTGEAAKVKLARYQSAIEADPEFEWCAEDAMTFDSVPYAGRVGENPFFVMTGYNKWGMTNSLACAKTVSACLLGQDAPYADILSPERFCFLKTPVAFLKNAGESALHMIKTPLSLPLCGVKSIKKGEGKVVLYKGRKRAVYRDDNGKLFSISPKCPHMGGELHFNPASSLWECPCHGSRFTIEGKLIDPPSIENAAAITQES